MNNFDEIVTTINIDHDTAAFAVATIEKWGVDLTRSLRIF